MPHHSAKKKKKKGFLLRSEANQACLCLAYLFNVALDSLPQLKERNKVPQLQREK